MPGIVYDLCTLLIKFARQWSFSFWATCSAVEARREDPFMRTASGMLDAIKELLSNLVFREMN